MGWGGGNRGGSSKTEGREGGGMVGKKKESECITFVQCDV